MVLQSPVADSYRFSSTAFMSVGIFRTYCLRPFFRALWVARNPEVEVGAKSRVWGFRVLGFRVVGFRVEGLRGMGFRGLGLSGLGLRV